MILGDRAPPDFLNAEDLRLPPPCRVGRRVEVHRTAVSTNDLALKALVAGDSEGLAIFAEEQTAGRGRQGRTWVSPPGRNLLFSVCLGPVSSSEKFPYLTVIGGIAVAQAVRGLLGLPARLRWPNDVVIGGRKIAGVLSESAHRGGRLTGHVIGIGVNVNMAPEDFPPDLRSRATSLWIESSPKEGALSDQSKIENSIDRASLARAILERLDEGRAHLQRGRDAAIREAWESLLVPAGDHVRVEEAGRAWEGRILRASLEDGLWVQLDEGPPRAFRAEHVRVEYLG